MFSEEIIKFKKISLSKTPQKPTKQAIKCHAQMQTILLSLFEYLKGLSKMFLDTCNFIQTNGAIITKVL